MIVGLTGPNAAGKGEVARLLQARGYALHSLSDVVRETALAEGRDVGRETLIEIGQRLRREFGPGVLAERILPRLTGRTAVDSVRSPFEVDVLRRLRSFRLLGVDAPVAVRWSRAVARGREGDVPDLATFVAREERENSERTDGQQLRRTLALADAVVVNDGGLDVLEHRVTAVIEGWESRDPAAGGPVS